MRTQHILVTTDFSDESARAFEPVADLAKKLVARVTLLHVAPPIVGVAYGYPYVPPSAPVIDSAQQIAAAQRHIEELRSEFGGEIEIKAEAIPCDTGQTDLAICSYAKSHDVDLIAISTHGRSGLRRWFLGSNAEKVLRSSGIPVLVFPPPHDD